MTKTQAKHLRSLELEPGVSACDLVKRLEKDGAHPLHHSVIGEQIASSHLAYHPQPFRNLIINIIVMIYKKLEQIASGISSSTS